MSEVSRLAFGVYGYDFPGCMTVRGIELAPLYACIGQVATDRNAMNLTGHGLLPAAILDADQSRWEETVYHLADAMTFCQQQWVMASKLVFYDQLDKLPTALPFIFQRPKSGNIIWNDAAMHSKFMETLLEKIDREPDGPIIRAFLRQVEISKLINPYWELQHFLAFTGLEILARNIPEQNYNTGGLDGLISRLSRLQGFELDPPLVKEWASGRNAAFHQGERIGTVTFDDATEKKVDVLNQLFSLRTLLADLLLKLLEFDDGKINWNRWRDRLSWGNAPPTIATVSELIALLKVEPDCRAVQRNPNGLVVRKYNTIFFGEPLALIKASSRAANLCELVDNAAKLNNMPILSGPNEGTYALKGSALCSFKPA